MRYTTPSPKLSPLARRELILEITGAKRITPALLDRFSGVSDRTLIDRRRAHRDAQFDIARLQEAVS